MTQKPKPPSKQISEWLSHHYNNAASELKPISGGFWSAAYSFRVAKEQFVLRFSTMAEGFTMDHAAMQFTSPDLPIPEVLELGEALGFHYAISRRHYGRFLEDISVEEANNAGVALTRLLAALRAAPISSNQAVNWHQPDDLSWHDWLRAGLIDKPNATVSGWRKKLTEHHDIHTIFKACEHRIETLLPYCPERRDLIHGDLLHQNVLITEDAKHITAIFSWKCSVRGDFLFDIAWCTVWGPWHPGIEAADLWQRTLQADDLNETDLLNAPLRHHCYELQIAASHFAWNIWTGNEQALAEVAARAEAILERRPLTTDW